MINENTKRISFPNLLSISTKLVLWQSLGSAHLIDEEVWRSMPALGAGNSRKCLTSQAGKMLSVYVCVEETKSSAQFCLK